ncbi:putative lipid-binding protein AIR1B [Brassica rapa]|uniref:Bifunctional inhibitor/plant lipid transfer protein/seed storage helical domain-containing protein n=1 Tax=Brassica campestris TaxID=3711 RepID=M4C7V9_BRACM|nr:putative lipid-binding protein AIR1B [Brassica rapa]
MAAKTSTILITIFLVINLLFLNFIPLVVAENTCPRDQLKLSTCANILNLINLNLGAPAMRPCCSVLLGLIDLDIALCFCSALKLSILGITTNTPIHLNLALNACGGTLPDGFRCPT